MIREGVLTGALDFLQPVEHVGDISHAFIGRALSKVLQAAAQVDDDG
jgi:hypothetical protein